MEIYEADQARGSSCSSVARAASCPGDIKTFALWLRRRSQGSLAHYLFISAGIARCQEEEQDSGGTYERHCRLRGDPARPSLRSARPGRSESER
ncbi:unnamed protein product [Arctogadus glacialis]